MWAAVLAAYLVACGGSSQPDTPDLSDQLYPSWDKGTARGPGAAKGFTRPVTGHELRAIQQLMAAAENVRGLRFERDVPVLVQDSAAIMTYVDSQVEPDELERSRAIYVALGLLDPTLDVRALLVRVMGEQVVGYYDVERGHLVVRDDVIRAFGGTRRGNVDVAEARVVLVHELVHALQGQHLGLSAAIERMRDSDAENAFRALVEGDATLAMIAYALQRESLQLSELTRNPARVRGLSEVVRSSPLTGSELGNAPAIVRVPLLSAYIDGLTFAANLHGDGGWARVDRAHADPPASSEQILHPERFARRDVPMRIRLPDARSALGGELELWHEDTLGELELSVYFGRGSGEGDAAQAAQGWGGDRIYAYRGRSGQTAVLWLTLWDDEQEAQQALVAAERCLQADAEAVRSRQLVALSQRTVLVARNVPPEHHEALRKRLAAVAGSLAREAASTHTRSP